MTRLTETLLEIAEGASAIVREVYETPFTVEFKGPKDPVTLADVRANAFICAALERAFPGVPIVAEESDPSAFSGYRSADRIFFVDPLDGTAEFVARNGEFVVMIGLVEGERATAGVVLAPTTRRAWVGELGEGAFGIDSTGARRPLRVTARDDLHEARLVASRSHRSDALKDAIARLDVHAVHTVGSAGLKGAAVAAGDAELYVGTGRTGKRWDVCATDAIVTAAGGKFSDARGVAFDYRAESLVNEHGLIASNGVLHEVTVRTLALPS